IARIGSSTAYGASGTSGLGAAPITYGQAPVAVSDVSVAPVPALRWPSTCWPPSGLPCFIGDAGFATVLKSVIVNVVVISSAASSNLPVIVLSDVAPVVPFSLSEYDVAPATERLAIVRYCVVP